jgi:hypothetical protein
MVIYMRTYVQQLSSRIVFMIRAIRKYVIMDGSRLSFEERRKDFQSIEFHGLRQTVGWLQARRLYGFRGFVPGKSMTEALKNKPAVFVISFHKNGTRSIHTYLEMLGFNGIHWPVFMTTGIDYESILHPIAHDPKQCVEALAPLLARYDFFSDVPFPGLFQELAETFPKSKFILTRRPSQEWGDSIWRHWRKFEPGANVHRITTFEAIQYRMPVDSIITESDLDTLIEKYVAHNESVQDYFTGTDRLLVADLDDPFLNVQMSQFLGVDPVLTFPRIREGAV